MEAAQAALSHGSLRRIAEGEQIEGPVLQCLQIKPMNSQTGSGSERYRVVMSDSVNFIQGMLAQQLNNLVHDKILQKGSICRLDQYQTNQVKDKLILVVLGCDVLTAHGEHEKFGAPGPLEGPKEEEEEAKPQPGNIASNGFYGSKPQQQQQQQQQQQPQPQRSLPSRTNGKSNGGSGTIQPIEALSPYAHKWSIKARCTSKSEIKTWHNKNGEGKLFSVNLLDESGEIRATGFNEAVDSWYEVFQEGRVYYISSPAKIQLAKKQFSNLNNDYEITFERETQVEKAEDMDGVPQVRYNFITIQDLQNVDKDATVDVIGILRTVGETVERTSKTTQKPYNMRELTVADNSGFDIRLTVWGKTAESFEVPVDSVVAFKGLKVSDFGGRSLSLLSSGTMTVDPDIDEAHKLKGWYDAAGRDESFQTHAGMSMAGATSGGRKDDTKTIAQVSDEGLGMNEEKPDYFNLKATIVYIKSDSSWSYPACQSESCNKKVVEINPGEFRCERCDKTWERPEHRYILSVNVSDHTGQMWLSCFNDTGEQIMGMTANELMAMRDEGDEARMKDVFSDANCKTLVFRVRAKMESFSDQQKVRYQVQSASPIDFSRESKKLADLIKSYTLAESSSLFVS